MYTVNMVKLKTKWIWYMYHVRSMLYLLPKDLHAIKEHLYINSFNFLAPRGKNILPLK